MSELSPKLPSIPAHELLQRINRGESSEINLTDVRESPFDTSFHDPDTPLPALPAGTRSLRTFSSVDDWEPGDTVRGTFNLAIDEQRGSFPSAEPRLMAVGEVFDVTHQIRRTTQFAIEAGHFGLEILGGVSLLGLRRVVTDLTRHASAARSGIHQAVSIGDVYAIDHPFSSRARPPIQHETLLVEGAVFAYKPGLPSYSPDGLQPELVVVNHLGELISIQIGDHHTVTYGSRVPHGPLDLIHTVSPPQPLRGDAVQLLARRGTIGRSADAGDGVLRIQNAQSLHLLDNSPRRGREEFRRMADMSALNDTLRGLGTVDAARSAIGTFLNSRLIDGVNGWYALDVTELERKELIATVNTLWPGVGSDETQLPMGLLETGDFGQIAHGFGSKMLSMSPAEFRSFTEKICKGHIYSDDITALSRLLSLFEPRPGISQSATARLAYRITNNFYKTYRDVLAAGTDIGEHHADFARQLLSFGLRHCDLIPRQASNAQGLLELLSFSLDKSLTSQPIRDLYVPLLSGLRASLERCGDWLWSETTDTERAKVATRITEPEAFELYHQYLQPRLTQLRQAIQSPEGEKDYDSQTRGTIVQEIELMEDMLRSLVEVAG